MQASSSFAPLMTKTTKTNKLFLFLFTALILTGCVQSTKNEITPHLSYSVQDKYLQNLRSIFNPLTEEEKETRWGTEYELGLEFAKKLDLYRAVTCFKRADILIEPTLYDRKAEIEYQIVNCYYLGRRYAEVIESFEESMLANTTRSFIGFRDLLVILFDSYLQEGDTEKSGWMVQALEKYFPTDAKKLRLTAAIQHADLPQLETLSKCGSDEIRFAELLSRSKKTGELNFEDEEDSFKIHRALHEDPEHETSLTLDEEIELRELTAFTKCKAAGNEILEGYEKKKKNPALAVALNATIPGLGYLYLGQTQTAFTSFWLNGLFIGTTAYFFKQGNIPAALITLGFESGWYFGGLVGVRENTYFYNERIYENEAHVKMRDHQLYPILMLSHGF